MLSVSRTRRMFPTATISALAGLRWLRRMVEDGRTRRRGAARFGKWRGSDMRYLTLKAQWCETPERTSEPRGNENDARVGIVNQKRQSGPTHGARARSAANDRRGRAQQANRRGVEREHPHRGSPPPPHGGKAGSAKRLPRGLQSDAFWNLTRRIERATRSRGQIHREDRMKIFKNSRVEFLSRIDWPSPSSRTIMPSTRKSLIRGIQRRKWY